MIADAQSFVSRWRSCCCRRGPCLLNKFTEARFKAMVRRLSTGLTTCELKYSLCESCQFKIQASRICKSIGMSFPTLGGWNLARLLLWDPLNIHDLLTIIRSTLVTRNTTLTSEVNTFVWISCFQNQAHYAWFGCYFVVDFFPGHISAYVSAIFDRAVRRGDGVWVYRLFILWTIA